MTHTRTLRTVLLFLIALLLTGAAGCGGEIKPGETKDVIATAKGELESIGFSCEYRDNNYDELTCDNQQSYKTLIKYYPQSRRLRFMSLFGLHVPCDEIYHEVMTYNWGYNVAQASCNEDTIAFLSYTIIPEGGMNGKDLKDFLEWWAGSLNSSLKESGLWDSIK